MQDELIFRQKLMTKMLKIFAHPFVKMKAEILSSRMASEKNPSSLKRALFNLMKKVVLFGCQTPENESSFRMP